MGILDRDYMRDSSRGSWWHDRSPQELIGIGILLVSLLSSIVWLVWDIGVEAPTGKQSLRVNINTASTAELQTLAGIGESRAQLIIACRSNANVDELLLIQSVTAQDLSFALEDDESQRSRLKDLQGSKSPPALSLSGWQNSQELTLEKLKGKIVILDFWATWCGPCIASIPHNNEIFERYKKDVVLIGICHPEGSDRMNDVVKSRSIKYPVAIDTNGSTIGSYKVNGYPDYYVLDKSGTLVAADCANTKVVDVIDALLKHQGERAP